MRRQRARQRVSPSSRDCSILDPPPRNLLLQRLGRRQLLTGSAALATLAGLPDGSRARQATTATANGSCTDEKGHTLTLDEASTRLLIERNEAAHAGISGSGR